MNKPTFKLSCVEKYDYSRKHYNSCWDIQVFLEETARWIRLYSSFSEYKARLAYEKIKDKYDLYIEDFLRLEGYLPMKDELYTRSPIMFELHNQIYKIEYIFPEQSCVVGLQIPGNKRYVQAEPDGSKYDYIEDDIFLDCDNLVIICYKNSSAYEYALENNIPVKLIGETATPGDASGDDTTDPKPTPDPTPVPTPVIPTPTPVTPVTPDPTPDPTPTPAPVTKLAAPAKKGTTFTVSSKNIKVKVTSSSKKNPTVTITKFTDKKAKKLTIPATVKVKGVTYKVTAISDKAFKGNKKLTTVTIGSNVTKIGKEAFSGCKNLKKITVTAGKLKTISKNAFKGINKKATITVKGTKKAKTALKKQLKKKSIGYVKTWKIK